MRMTQTKPNVHFLVGTGRCGSSLIHEILCRHPGVSFMSNLDDRLNGNAKVNALNPLVYRRLPARFTEKGRVRFAPSEGYRALRAEVSPALVKPPRDLTAADLTPWLERRLVSFFARRAGVQPGDVFVHKLTGWPRVGFLKSAFPEGRFVQIIRDGRAVATSWLKMSWWLGYEGPQNWQWGPLPPLYQEAWERSERSFVTLAGIGWLLLMDSWEKAKQTLPAGSWIEIRYEDFLSQPQTTIETLESFLGLPHDIRTPKALASFAVDETRGRRYLDDMGSDALSKLNDLLEVHLSRYGYDL